jgi:ring-1,2-phenylacetyl-CoA epoxidase subunit PaaA
VADPVSAQVRSISDLDAQPPVYRDALEAVLCGLVLNELQSVVSFDEPAIALAPTPYSKWLSCRLAMESFEHHRAFMALARQVGVAEARLDPGRGRLAAFGVELKTWPEFCVIKVIADIARALQAEDLASCSFHPLRNVARAWLPAARLHARIGRDLCLELLQAGLGTEVQETLNRCFPLVLAVFGGMESAKEATCRRFGLKRLAGPEMRREFIARSGALIVKDFGLRMPSLH